MLLNKTIALITCAVLVFACESPNDHQNASEKPGDATQQAILQVHEDYLQGWRDMDESKVMSLLEEGAMIQPNRLRPIQGKENIREFWFPKDSSVTQINTYETEVLSFVPLDTLMLTTHRSLLDWTYRKDTLEFSMKQTGINTTLYRRQADGEWKIWRSMWTDIKQEPY